jgi:chemotaxis protein methyltransferase CheR
MNIEHLELRLLTQAIFEVYQHDFRNYSVASLQRRVTSAQEKLGCDSISQLQGVVVRDPLAFDLVFSQLTVQVTDMFRDPEHFRIFRTEIIPLLKTYPTVRLWVAGCSTGEEPYSYAVVLKEEGLLDRTTLYGTDISSDALGTAKTGVYDMTRLAAFSTNHRQTGAPVSLSEHYSCAYDSAVFDPELRRHAVFADHSLATDDVFAEVQVVSCRNVLIYFDRTLNERALDVMHRSLCHRGFLGLGAQETLQFTRHRDAFDALPSYPRWYQKS